MKYLEDAFMRVFNSHKGWYYLYHYAFWVLVLLFASDIRLAEVNTTEFPIFLWWLTSLVLYFVNHMLSKFERQSR